MKENRSIDCKVYEQPAIEILEVAVEAGFQSSQDPVPDYNNNIFGGSTAGELEDDGSWY